ncbi:hypothetical protein FOC1_g10004282 [Fusarium oxysporum f. sp. cubense race 1]|uniref:CBM-cenC domain-containing protein n=1 Tax=Fusarium oxysporum f. sp. cubense (strain race 1) TaxID=1229664 RepID=N4TLX2_FUSC1|nr:hypothetical protein FOC1_g10004282 [Fusarium oxysporum f. sp. cubense race 1]
MVSLKAIGVAYAAANLLGVNAGLCRPSTRTSLSQSGSGTPTSAPIVSTSTSGSGTIATTSTDHASSSDETTATNPTTSGTQSVSSSETIVSSSNPTTSDVSAIETSSSHTISVDLTTSGSPTTSSDAVTSAESTTSGASTMSTETSASIDSTTSGVPTTTAETSAPTDVTSTEATTSDESTTSADTTTTANPTTTADTTTTSSEPTTTTSVCVEPTNLLRQPGFEASDDGSVWGFYWGGGDVEYDPDQARTGDYLGVLPVPDGQERRMEQRIHITPGSEYTVSFWYAVANPPSVSTQCFLFATFDYYTTLKQVPLPSDSEYHQYTSSFIAQDNLDPAIEIGVSCPGVGNGYTATINIDDTSVLDSTNACDATPVDPNAPPKSTLLVPAQPEAPHCPVNVVQVPGFEADDEDQAWAFYNRGEFVQDVSNARTGEREALLPSGTRSDGTFLEQYIDSSNLVAGETYDYHFFWKPKTLPDSGRCYINGGYSDLVGFSAAEVKFGATSSTGYTLYSVRFEMPAGSIVLQIVFVCDGNDLEVGSVYVDDTALIRVGGCEAYPVTGALIENPSFEIQATEDSTYAWFGTKGMTIRAGSTADGPSPNSGDNFLYVQLGSSKKSATLTKPLASSLNAGGAYTLQFNWSAGSAYVPSTCSFKIVFGSVSQTLELDEQVTAYQYQSFDYSFTAADSTESMSITVECTDASGFPDFVFDDFSLQ